MNKILKDYFEIKDEYNKRLEILEKATTSIVGIIKRVFKRKNAWWAYGWYDTECAPPSPSLPFGGFFKIYISQKCDSGKWDYADGFPIEFFDMTEKEIEYYIRAEIDASKKEKEAEKLKTDTEIIDSNLKKQLLIKSAKEKLTAEEKKALGLK